MRIFRTLREAHELGPCCVAIGTFDGVHLGHQALVRSAIARARMLGFPAAVLTFDKHPMEVLDPPRAPTLLTTPTQREIMMEGLGVDALVVVAFDEGLRNLSPEEFCQVVLVDGLHAQSVHVGEGFAFGRGRAGTLQVLRLIGSRLGFLVHVEPLVVVDGSPVSSSRVREALLSGEVEAAASMLGRPYALAGTVQRGAGMGRKLGFPTVNLGIPPRQTLPADGVYATVVRGADFQLPGACSIGTRPTVGGEDRVFEVYILDFSGNLYGLQLEVEFLHRLRDQVRYRTLDELVQQMHADVELTRTFASRRHGRA